MSGVDPAVREARADARLVLYVARARLRLGDVPYDLADRLAAVAIDERVQVRRRRIAAEVMARLRARSSEAS